MVVTRTVVVAETLPTVAVTVASRVVVNCVRASPLPSVMTLESRRAPALVPKVTGTPGSRWLFSPVATARISTVPPLGPTALGVAVTVSCDAAAAPTCTSSASAWAPPEKARICATPDAVPAFSRTVALPPLVRASAGWMLPRVVVKLTCVPFCTGTPPGSVTLAVISTEPLRATTV